MRGGARVMSINQKSIKVPPDSELSLRLQATRMSGEPLVVDTGEGIYTLLVVGTEPARDVFANYDPQAAIAGVRALDEAFAGVDRELLLRDLHAQRAQGSRGRPA